MDRAGHQRDRTLTRGAFAGLTALIIVAFAIQASIGTLKPGTLEGKGGPEGTSARQIVHASQQQAVRSVRKQRVRPDAVVLAMKREAKRGAIAPNVCDAVADAPRSFRLAHAILDLPPPARG